jgi:hypothetical protein
MNREKLRELREHLEFVDDRYTHRLRGGGGSSLVRAGTDELEKRQRELAEYAIELKGALQQLLEILDEENSRTEPQARG